ncbi:type II toxin-antitoxin system YoeB family toxin [Sutterella wadsworthensis]|nr:type II toxin-antitoxin system YoeB family toxin [Sutterella wadsworthensis]
MQWQQKNKKVVRRINTLVNGQVSCPLSGQILTPTVMPLWF